MLSQLLIIISLSLYHGSVLHHGHSDPHGDRHSGNCVDTSHYLDVEYNVTNQPWCRNKLIKVCRKMREEVCIPVTRVTCDMVAYVDCFIRSTVSNIRNDKVKDESFVTKECKVDKVLVLEEEKKMPVCCTVTKQQCDSRWLINKVGEKIWAGNENCRNVSWVDCVLEENKITVDVPTYSCEDSAILQFSSFLINTEEVTSHERICQPRGEPLNKILNVQLWNGMNAEYKWRKSVS